MNKSFEKINLSTNPLKLVKDRYAEPYTIMLVIFSIISVISIPCYYLAGKKYKADKLTLEQTFG